MRLGLLTVLLVDIHVEVLDFTMDDVIMELYFTAKLHRDFVVELAAAVISPSVDDSHLQDILDVQIDISIRSE